MSKTITAIFDNRAEVDAVLQRFEQAGFSSEQISLLLSEKGHGQHFRIVEDDKSDEGAIAGAAIGGLAGTLYLGLASAGTFLIPGLNLVASGALIGSLAGLGAGGTIGAIVGALVGATVPEHEAKVFEDRLRAGGILVAINALSDEQEKTAKSILKDFNAQNIKAVAA